MSNGAAGPGPDGNVATLLRTTREAERVSQLKLSEQTGIARSTINNAEEGKRDATLDTACTLARALGIPLLMVSVEHNRDALRNNPNALAEFERELAATGYGDTLAEFFGIEVGASHIRAVFNDAGSVNLRRELKECRPTRSLRSMSFWTRASGKPGKAAPFLTLHGPSMDYEQKVTFNDGQRVDRIVFPRPWRADDDPMDVVLETSHPDAYRPGGDSPGVFRVYIEHDVARLVIEALFPSSYLPEWGKPFGHWNTQPFDLTADYDLVAGRICRDFSFTPSTHTATLVVEKPRPGFSYGIRWLPPEGAAKDRE